MKSTTQVVSIRDEAGALGRNLRQVLGLAAGTGPEAALTALLGILPGISVERSQTLETPYALPFRDGRVHVTVPASWAGEAQADGAMSLIGQALVLLPRLVELGTIADPFAFGSPLVGEAFRTALLGA